MDDTLRDESTGLGASAQGDGDYGTTTEPKGEPTETSEAPTTNSDPGDESDSGK